MTQTEMDVIGMSEVIGRAKSTWVNGNQNEFLPNNIFITINLCWNQLKEWSRIPWTTDDFVEDGHSQPAVAAAGEMQTYMVAVKGCIMQGTPSTMSRCINRANGHGLYEMS